MTTTKHLEEIDARLAEVDVALSFADTPPAEKNALLDRRFRLQTERRSIVAAEEAAPDA